MAHQVLLVYLLRSFVRVSCPKVFSPQIEKYWLIYHDSGPLRLQAL